MKHQPSLLAIRGNLKKTTAQHLYSCVSVSEMSNSLKATIFALAAMLAAALHPAAGLEVATSVRQFKPQVEDPPNREAIPRGAVVEFEEETMEETEVVYRYEESKELIAEGHPKEPTAEEGEKEPDDDDALMLLGILQKSRVPTAFKNFAKVC